MTETYWIVAWPAGDFVSGTSYSMRRNAQAAAVRMWGQRSSTWRELYKKGYRCVKVTITEVKP